MTTNDYLEGILESQKLSQEELDNLAGHRDEVEKFLREEFGQDPMIRFAGSHAKGTMIKEGYDLDVVCYFPHNYSGTLKEIHDDVKNRIAEKYDIKEKASAVRIENIKEQSSPNDYHIDVVPGRFIDESDNSDVFLHVVYGDKERMQTNIETHIKYISKSDCRDIIKLVKLWNCRNNLDIKTFFLEVFTIETLKGYQNKTDLKLSFLKTLEALKNDIVTKQLIDPANSNNIISKILSSSHKELISQKAEESLSAISADDNDADKWKSIFKEDSADGNVQKSVLIRNPASPWSI